LLLLVLLLLVLLLLLRCGWGPNWSGFRWGPCGPWAHESPICGHVVYGPMKAPYGPMWPIGP
jgi:hypothetical protein